MNDCDDKFNTPLLLALKCELLKTLKPKDGTNGTNGTDGNSAYEIAVKSGFIGDEQEWLLSLNGKDGKQGEQGEQGEKGSIQNVIQLIPYASGNFNTLTTNADGSSKNISILGFGNSYEHNNPSEIKLENGQLPNYALYVYDKATIQSLDVHCTVVEKTSVTGSGLIQATIYLSDGATFTPATTVNLTPPITGTIQAGTTFSGRLNNIGTEIDYKKRVLIGVSIKNNYANANTVKIQTNANLKLKIN